MSVVVTGRRIDLEALGFAASMRQSGDAFEVEADQPRDVLQAAVDACPLDSRDDNRAVLMDRARRALTANAAFLALSSPTNAQIRDHLRLLTRENNALIRLALGDLADTDGT